MRTNLTPLDPVLESSRFESIRQNFSPPYAFIRDLTSGKSSSAKRTSGESEVFDPRADSNRLCFKTIRLNSFGCIGHE